MKIQIFKSEHEKRGLIQRLSNDGIELAVYFDEDPDGSFSYRAIRPGLLVVVPPFDFDVLEQWWYYGNWQAIAPVSPGYEPFDTFRSSETKIKRCLEVHNLSMIIDSFHDDAEWNVIER